MMGFFFKILFVFITLFPHIGITADEVPLSAFISSSQSLSPETKTGHSMPMVDVTEQTLSDLIDNQGISSEVIETDYLSLDQLQKTDEINISQSFDNNIVYETDDNSDRFNGMAQRDAEKNSCKKSNDENTVCANVMCSFGLLMGEWSDECTQHLLDMTLLKARTPPWKKLPRCMMVDENCNNDGRATTQQVDDTFCDSIGDLEKRHSCLLALDINEEKKATEFIERNNIDVDVLDVIEFEPMDNEAQDQSNSFLAIHIDSRYAYDDALFESNGQYVPAQRLSDYLQRRHALSSMSDIYQQLVEDGVLKSECADVGVNEFYNCNQFSDVPERCWSASNHESIINCVREITAL